MLYYKTDRPLPSTAQGFSRPTFGRFDLFQDRNTMHLPL